MSEIVHPKCLKNWGTTQKSHLSHPEQEMIFSTISNQPVGTFCEVLSRDAGRGPVDNGRLKGKRIKNDVFFFEGLGVEVDGCDLGVWRSLGISGEFLFQSEFLSAEKPTFPQQLVNQLVTGSRFFWVPLSFRVVHIFWDVMLFFPFLVELKYTHLRWCLRALRCFFPRFFFHSQDDGLPGKPPAPWRGTRH